MKNSRVPVLLPTRSRRNWSPRAFVRELPNVARAIAQLRFSPTALAVLDAHILASSRAKSLSAISRELGITKQAAHAIFNRMILKFREILLEEKYRMCGFRIRPEFSRPLQGLSRKLQVRSTRDFRYSEWNALVARTWGINTAQMGAAEPLVLEILGLRRHDFSTTRLTSVVTDAVKTKTRRERAGSFIRRLLRSRYPAKLTLKKIIDVVSERPSFRGIDEKKIRTLLSSMKEVEKRGNSYRLTAASMASRADQYEQILQRAGRPLHYRELAKRARRFGFTGNTNQHQSVTNILVADPRFIPVAHTGRWALAAWPNLETRTITEIMFEEISNAGRPLHEDELVVRVTKRRPAKRPSIPRMLAANDKFRKVEVKTWTINE